MTSIAGAKSETSRRSWKQSSTIIPTTTNKMTLKTQRYELQTVSPNATDFRQRPRRALDGEPQPSDGGPRTFDGDPLKFDRAHGLLTATHCIDLVDKSHEEYNRSVSNPNSSLSGLLPLRRDHAIAECFEPKLQAKNQTSA
uniref:Uncharacterized protein n=1 Tax=Cucumis melo TaxID=3656 RepID=A0A9I9DW61_CUCME